MTAVLEPKLEPAGSRGRPGRDRKFAGTDDRCTWVDHLRQRCTEPATDTVRGKLYCSPHADLVAGI